MTPFVDSYGEARDRFLSAAAAAGGRIDSYVNPAGKGPGGETLAADSAWLGDPDATRILLCLSGVHGVEGAAGASAQLAWLLSGGAERIPPNVAVLMVHAVNPWGFAYTSRFNENNVDLNRNFVDHESAYPDNPHYPAFHDILAVPDLEDDTLQTMRARTRTFAQSLGRIDARIAMNGGQNGFDDGTSYAGTGLEWSNALLRDLCERRLSHARHVCLIDWHTGYGEYGEVCFLSKKSMRKQCANWWGDVRFSTTKRSRLPVKPSGTKIKKRPLAPGQFRDALPALLPNAKITGATIEFGSIQQPGDWLFGRIYERWLRVHGNRTDKDALPLIRHIRKVFISDETAWREQVTHEGTQITNQAVQGLAVWDADLQDGRE